MSRATFACRRAARGLSLCGALLLTGVAPAAEEAPAAEAPSSPDTFSANVGLFSEYVFRGITNTNEGPAIQGGFDYAHESGFYAGVWASKAESTLAAG